MMAFPSSNFRTQQVKIDYSNRIEVEKPIILRTDYFSETAVDNAFLKATQKAVFHKKQNSKRSTTFFTPYVSRKAEASLP